MHPAIHDYTAFDQAYEYFNAELFAGELPLCYITLQRKGKRTYGYYSPERFVAHTSTERTDAIALNPDISPVAAIRTFSAHSSMKCATSGNTSLAARRARRITTVRGVQKWSKSA
jgi:hypothetical protein